MNNSYVKNRVKLLDNTTGNVLVKEIMLNKTIAEAENPRHISRKGFSIIQQYSLIGN